MDGTNVSRNRRTALGFGVLACLALIAFVFAFLQQAEAKRQAEIAMENQLMATACKAETAEKTKQIEDQIKQLEMTTENLRLAIIDAQWKKDQAQKKLK